MRAANGLLVAGARDAGTRDAGTGDAGTGDAGKKSEAESLLKQLLTSSKTEYVSNVQLACVLFSLGRRDEAFVNLEKAYKRKEIDLADIRLIPEMIDLRADPRWALIEKKMGLRE